MLRGKKILQSLCKEGVGWDDDIPESQRHDWQQWRDELPLQEKIRIPRCHKPNMELAAALVSVKVSQTLYRELTYLVAEEVFWTDSQVVKAYINNEARRFHTYVAYRV